MKDDSGKSEVRVIMAMTVSMTMMVAVCMRVGVLMGMIVIMIMIMVVISILMPASLRFLSLWRHQADITIFTACPTAVPSPIIGSSRYTIGIVPSLTIGQNILRTS